MIFIGLGANLPSRFGAPEDTLMAAREAIEARGVRVLCSSSIWMSAPVPASDQPWYRNAVVAVDTALSVPDLLHILKEIEQEFGREEAQRNAPRVLDLDILAYHDEIFNDLGINVPHPRMDNRAFVLLPLQEICQNWIHPVSRKKILELVSELPESQDIRQVNGGAF